MPQKFAERRFPLHVHISALFTLLLLLTGVVLGLFNYRQTSQIILSSSDELFDRISQEVETDLRQTYQPTYHLLNLLALGGTHQRLNSFDRLDILLRPLTQALQDNPKLAALYAQSSKDAVVIDAASDIGQVTTNLSNKIWQKITVAQQLTPPAWAMPAASPLALAAAQSERTA